ncbi:MAG TPA: hypothetical protein G4N92_09775 [Anaerolineae bacterium]|nr:hypothetical protein [Anaerolineae bacterium]
MTLPAFFFGSLIASLIGSIIHLIFGGNIKRIVSYIFFSWVGFWIGNTVSSHLNIQILLYGPVDFGMAAIGSCLLLAFIYWLSFESDEEE